MSIDTSVGRVDGVRVSIDTSVQVSGQGSELHGAVRFLSLGQWTLAHSLGGPGPLNTKNKNRAPKARFCGQKLSKTCGFPCILVTQATVQPSHHSID